MTARIDSPPRSKKSSSRASSVSVSSSFCQIAATRSSVVVAGGRERGFGVRFKPRPSRSAIPSLGVLPVGRGIDSTKITRRGTLLGASIESAWSRTIASLSDGSELTTAAPTSSPKRLCGMAKAAASRIAGWAISASSTSIGETFSPPRLICSLTRPASDR